MPTQKEQRARFGEELDWIICEIVLEFICLVVSVILG